MVCPTSQAIVPSSGISALPELVTGGMVEKDIFLNVFMYSSAIAAESKGWATTRLLVFISKAFSARETKSTLANRHAKSRRGNFIIKIAIINICPKAF